MNNEAVFTSDKDATIDKTLLSAYIKVPYGTDITALVPTIEVDTGVTVYVSDVEQTSGDSSQDFSSTVTYKLSNGEFLSTDWSVNVSYLPAPVTDFTVVPGYKKAYVSWSIPEDSQITSLLLEWNLTDSLGDASSVSITGTDLLSGEYTIENLTNLVSYDFKGSSHYSITDKDVLLNKDTDLCDESSEIPGRSGAVYSKDLEIDSYTHKKTSEVIVIPEDQPLTIEGRSSTTLGCFPNGRTVTLTPFIMGQYEVTKELFTKVLGVNMFDWLSQNNAWDSAKEKAGRATENQDLRPAYSVNLYMAIAFCNKLSVMQGLDPCYTVEGVDFETLTFDDIPWIANGGNAVSSEMQEKIDIWNAFVCDYSKNGYRLPTEAEWECAARGGSYTYATETEAASLGDNDYWNYAYPGTNTDSEASNYFWFNDNSNGSSHEVGLKKPNFINIYDICGNVVEWCNDWQNPSDGHKTPYEGESPYTDPVVANISSSYKNHVLRGSLYTATKDKIKVYKRDGTYFYYDSRAFRGVRLVRRFAE